MVQKVFVSFASPNMRGALRRIARQAMEMDRFDVILPYEADGLDTEFVSAFRDRLQEGVRGFGYWAWKAQVVKQALAKMDDGDVLLYADAGCHLNSEGRSRLDQYLEMLSPDCPFVVFQHDPQDSVFGETNPNLASWPNRDWTKGDLIDYFDIRNRDEILSGETYYATAFFMQKNSISNRFVEDWLAPARENWELLDDTPSVSPNLPGFVEHRHDQSIFSVLCNLYPVNTLSACEIVYPKIHGRGGDWKKLKGFPIHARRDRRDRLSSRLKGIRIDASLFLRRLLKL